MSKESDFYEKLRGTLEETTTFPTKYMFKFIIPSGDDKILKNDKLIIFTLRESIKQVEKLL